PPLSCEKALSLTLRPIRAQNTLRPCSVRGAHGIDAPGRQSLCVRTSVVHPRVDQGAPDGRGLGTSKGVTGSAGHTPARRSRKPFPAGYPAATKRCLASSALRTVDSSKSML